MTKKQFLKTFKFEGYMSPTLFTSVLDGKKYAVSGGTWIEVPEFITYEDVVKSFISLREKSEKSDLEDFIVKVKSSRGKGDYFVKLKNGNWSCTCSGFGFRR